MQFIVSSTSVLVADTAQLNNRQALRYAIRNTSLPARVRVQAQLQLARMHAYTRSTQIKNRCIAGGIARSVFRDFRIARVRYPFFSIPLCWKHIFS
jgi:ribosomal protein S14